MTTYVILRKLDGLSGDCWGEIGRVEARSDVSAIRQHGDDDGVCVAVPARSWRPRTVRAEQTTRLTIT